MSEMNSKLTTQNGELRALSEHWGRGLLSTDETMGWLLAYLVRQNQELRTKNQEAYAATLPAQALSTLLRQIGDTVDTLAGPQLVVNHGVCEGRFWRGEPLQASPTHQNQGG